MDSAYGRLKDSKDAIGGYTSKLSTKLEVATDKLADKVEASLVKSENKIDYLGSRINSIDLDKLPDLSKDAVMTVGFFLGNLAYGQYTGSRSPEDALAIALITGLLYGIARRTPDALKHIEITEKDSQKATTLYDGLQNLYHRLGESRVKIKK